MAEADFLKSTVGAVLAKGVADTLASNPEDPVQYLGQWLHRYVGNVKVKEALDKKLSDQAAAEEVAKKDLIAAQHAEQAILDAKKAAVEQVHTIM